MRRSLIFMLLLFFLTLSLAPVARGAPLEGVPEGVTPFPFLQPDPGSMRLCTTPRDEDHVLLARGTAFPCPLRVSAEHAGGDTNTQDASSREPGNPMGEYAYPQGGLGIRSDGLGFAFEPSSELALTGALSFSVGKISGIRGHLNGIFRPSSWEIRSEDLGAFPLYAGAGVILGGEAGFLLGMRFPVGVEHHLQGTPLKVFLEFSPYFEFIRSGKGNVTFSSGSGSFGILYFF